MTRRHLAAVALAGALIGLWISPGRGYAAPAPDQKVEWSACAYEDGSGQPRCVWDARHMGDGKGQSLKIIHGGEDDARYVEISHRKAHRLIHEGN